MKNKKEKVEVIDINKEVGNASESDLIIDQEAIKVTEKRIREKNDEMKDKVYSVSMTKSLLDRLNSFILNDVEWTNKEALGVIEVNKELLKINKEGIKSGFIYMKSLPLQAIHYFVSKSKGIGLESAEKHMELLKVLDEGLERSTADVKELKELENELAGLQQGLVTE